jgi:hypothetical protein
LRSNLSKVDASLMAAWYADVSVVHEYLNTLPPDRLEAAGAYVAQYSEALKELRRLGEAIPKAAEVERSALETEWEQTLRKLVEHRKNLTFDAGMLMEVRDVLGNIEDADGEIPRLVPYLEPTPQEKHSVYAEAAVAASSHFKRHFSLRQVERAVAAWSAFEEQIKTEIDDTYPADLPAT